MKKLMITAAAALCATLAVNAEGVESGIVGYNTATLAQGQSKAFGVHFDDVAEAGKAIAVNEIFTIAAGSITGTSAWGAAMDQIWFWDKANDEWKFYGYQKPRTAGSVASWKKYNIQSKTFSELTSADTLTQGDTFLYIHNEKNSLSLNLAGAVKPFEAQPTYAIAQGQSQYIAYPWPVQIKISDFSAAKFFDGQSLTGTSAWGAAMDQIWLWDQANDEWKFYGYQKPRTAGSTAAWKRYNSQTKQFTEVTDADVIPADEGILYIHNEKNTLNIKFTY